MNVLTVKLLVLAASIAIAASQCYDLTNQCQNLQQYCGTGRAILNGIPFDVACPYSCGLCSSQYLDYQDYQNFHCSDLIDCSQISGLCGYPYSINGMSILEACPSTCGTCGQFPPPPPLPVQPCLDYPDYNCPVWSNYCNTNTLINGYLVNQACPYTCGRCGNYKCPTPCKDNPNYSCDLLNYFCSSGSSIDGVSILNLCPETCGMCGTYVPPPPPPAYNCQDYDSRCPQLGYACSYSNSYLDGVPLSQTCPYTCGQCNSYQPPQCANAFPNWICSTTDCSNDYVLPYYGMSAYYGCLATCTDCNNQYKK